jgi:flagellar protein FliO/FliZ
MSAINLHFLTILSTAALSNGGDETSAGPNFELGVLRMITTLVSVIAIILLLSWGVRKLLSAKVTHLNQTNAIRILSQRALSPKTQVYLLEVEGRGIVVAESASGVYGLAELDLKESPLTNEQSKHSYPQKTASREPFAKIFERFKKLD